MAMQPRGAWPKPSVQRTASGGVCRRGAQRHDAHDAARPRGATLLQHGVERGIGSNKGAGTHGCHDGLLGLAAAATAAATAKYAAAAALLAAATT